MRVPLSDLLDTKKRRALTVVTLFALALLASALSPLAGSDGVEEPDAFVEALRATASELRPGDRVLVHPPWRDDVLDAMGAAGVLPRGVEATLALSRQHGQPLRRVWVLQDPAVPLPRALRRAMSHAGSEHRAGVRVTLVDEAPAGDAASRLDDRLPEAQVYVVTEDGKRTDCAYSANAGRHLCKGLPDWMYVGPYKLHAGGRSHACVWSHPTTNGRVVTRFERVPLPPVLALSHGLTDHAASKPDGAPVTVAVKVDSVEIGRAVHPNRGGLLTDRFSVPRPSSSGTVEIEVTTPDAGMRHFCWSLELVEETP